MNRLILSVGIILFLACGPPNEGSRPRSSASADSLVEAMLRQPHNEMLGLLAVKYGLDSATVIAVTSAYLHKIDFLYRALTDTTRTVPESGPSSLFPEIHDVIHVVDSLAVAYSIPRDQLAGLLTDFRLAEARKQE